jgi:hypothetical protein
MVKANTTTPSEPAHQPYSTRVHSWICCKLGPLVLWALSLVNSLVRWSAGRCGLLARETLLPIRKKTQASCKKAWVHPAHRRKSSGAPDAPAQKRGGTWRSKSSARTHPADQWANESLNPAAKILLEQAGYVTKLVCKFAGPLTRWALLCFGSWLIVQPTRGP